MPLAYLLKVNMCQLRVMICQVCVSLVEFGVKPYARRGRHRCINLRADSSKALSDVLL